MHQFYEEIGGKALDALWRRHQEDGPPRGPYPARHWKWDDIEPFTRRAMELVRPGPDAHRRVLTLNNPAAPGGATHTITGAVQIVLPGEIAPSHRHTAAAIRFIIQGTGTITMVDGEPCVMEPGDLVLTPGWSWHGHINQGTGPMIWMDSLDVPIVAKLQAMRQETYPDELNPATKDIGDSEGRYGAGYLQPVWENSVSPISPLLRFPWAKTEEALHRLAKYDASPFDDVAFRYTNPATGKDVLPTLGCWIQMLRPGVHTRAHRHTTTAVYHVFRGSGSTIVNGVQIDWKKGDFISLPPWTWHEHLNSSSSEEAILFSTNDKPIFDSLNLYTEEEYTENKGYQKVTSMYDATA
jgi:gentisate 1,2-dioxygenase